MSAFSTYVLSSENETWIRELRSRILDELDAMEGGRRFRKAVQLVLQRDQNWVSHQSMLPCCQNPADVSHCRSMTDRLEAARLSIFYPRSPGRRRSIRNGTKQASRRHAEAEAVPVPPRQREPQPNVGEEPDEPGRVPARRRVRPSFAPLMMAFRDADIVAALQRRRARLHPAGVPAREEPAQADRGTTRPSRPRQRAALATREHARISAFAIALAPTISG